MSPMDFVQKLSNVACVIQCSGIWIGGKGWGLTWKMIQCVVKPREIVSVYGKCHIQLSSEDVDQMGKSMVTSTVADEEDGTVDAVSAAPTTVVEDSDGEDDVVDEPLPTPPPVKKVIKVAPTVVDTTPPPAAAAVVQESPAVVEPAKKKVVKKKV